MDIYVDKCTEIYGSSDLSFPLFYDFDGDHVVLQVCFDALSDETCSQLMDLLGTKPTAELGGQSLQAATVLPLGGVSWDEALAQQVSTIIGMQFSMQVKLVNAEMIKSPPSRLRHVRFGNGLSAMKSIAAAQSI